ncbi:unnamed protein product [Prorocentrum cordatum]|uniref:Uncharacterized protein n=1 Tax=Prorocentrum cordatum TaxID=2364126 RepID=A0ABN9T5Y8_9DINO|nr:unnamed protein product [Polarella glacialis]
MPSSFTPQSQIALSASVVEQRQHGSIAICEKGLRRMRPIPSHDSMLAKMTACDRSSASAWQPQRHSADVLARRSLSGGLGKPPHGRGRGEDRPSTEAQQRPAALRHA